MISMLFVVGLAFAGGTCDQVVIVGADGASSTLRGHNNPVTGAPYTDLECARIVELLGVCPGNPLVPGNKGFTSAGPAGGASADGDVVTEDQARAFKFQSDALASGAAEARAYAAAHPFAEGGASPVLRSNALNGMLVSAFRDLRARTLLADHVLSELDAGGLEFDEAPPQPPDYPAAPDPQAHYRALYTAMVRNCVPQYKAIEAKFCGRAECSLPPNLESWVCDLNDRTIPDGSPFASITEVHRCQ